MARNDRGPIQMPPEVERTSVRIAPPVRIGGGAEVVESEHVTFFNTEEPGSNAVTTIHICADCNKVMHKPEEVGGVCVVCQRFLCTESARFSCVICGKSVCRSESFETSKGRVCNNHGFLRVIAFLAAGKKKTKPAHEGEGR